MTLPQSSSQQQQSQHFLLKWNNHRSNMVNVFETLLQAENLVDVTIAVEGKFLKAHKIVLSACSPYFESMFVSQTPSEKHPILIFHDMKFAHLKTLLDFMYRGEISIDERDLSDVLKVAEALSIRGLSSFESDDEDSEKSSEPGPSSSSNAANAPSTSNSTGGDAGGGGGETFSSNSPSTAKGSKNSHASPQGPSSSSSSSSTVNEPSSSKGNAHSFSNHTYSGNATAGQSDNHSSGKNSGCDSVKVKNSSSTKEKSSSKSNGVSGHGKSGSKNAVVQENNVTAVAAAAAAGASGSPAVPVKRKRGRQPKNRPVVPPVQPPPPPIVVKPPPTTDQQFSFPTAKAPLPPRQGVRRRIPRRFSGVASRIKREKLDPGSNDAEQEDTEMFDAALLGADLGSEPLSEMSVRGLDLFKYASVEDGVYKCIACEKLRIPKTFKNKYSFQRHAFLYHEGNMRKVFPCPVCSREFSRPDKMKNHLRSVHEAGNKDAGGSGSNGHSPINDDPNTVLVKGTELHETCDF